MENRRPKRALAWVALIAGLAKLGSGCSTTSPSTPADYRINWTFVNNTTGGLRLAGTDPQATGKTCQSGTCVDFANVQVDPGQAVAATTNGPGNVTVTTLHAYFGTVGTHDTADPGVAVASGKVTAVTVTWDGTNMLFNTKLPQ